jgi:hypothetical protein
MTGDHILDLWPEPPKGGNQRIKHFLDVYDDLPDDYMILMSTPELYGRHVRTGVSIGDLRQLYNLGALSTDTVGTSPAGATLGTSSEQIRRRVKKLGQLPRPENGDTTT